MKKYLILAMLFVLAVVLVSPVSVSAKTKAGVKSGSFFYFFDKAFERADLFFTFSPEKKAKKVLENADERLAEAEESASENNQEAVSEAMKDYQKNIEVLEKVLSKVPEEAKEAITKAIEADKERREEMTKKIEEINNEIKKEDNDFKKDEDEKLNDDVGDNESGKEEVENENKKDEQKKEIEKLKQNKESQPKKIDQSLEIERLQKEVEDLKKKVEKQSNISSSLDLSPVNTTPSNIIFCNGKNWTACPSGQKFYCPSNGDAQCLSENIGSNSVIENSALKIEKCKAERDSVRNKMLEESRQLVEEGLKKFQDQLLQQFYNSISPGTVTASEMMTTLIAPQIKTKREKDMQTMTTGIDMYLNDEYTKCLNQ